MRIYQTITQFIVLPGLLLLSLTVFFLTPQVVGASSAPASTYILVYKSPEAVNRALLKAQGDVIIADLGRAGVLVVRSNNPHTLAMTPGIMGIAHDRMRVSIPKDETILPSSIVSNPISAGCANTHRPCPQQWDLQNIHLARAWQKTRGQASVRVAVLDTGVSSAHEEVGSNYDQADSVSFVQPSEFCPQDSKTYGSTEDFNGHGTWTSTHIAGVNGKLMSGIAPATTLINVRVLGACGYGQDSWLLAGMLYAHLIGASIESMSIGGYLCGGGVVAGSFYCGNQASVGSDPIIYQAYHKVVQYLLDHGTVVVAAAGNEHVQINRDGMVSNHASLQASFVTTTPGADPSNDLYGLYEAPGAIPGVISVAALNRVTLGATAGETKYGQIGINLHQQLSYYSNYGERIDVAAPGGARAYNVPRFDCLDTNCTRLDPTSLQANDNAGDFGAWAFDSKGRLCNHCYVNVQGTSMATPQVAGVAALYLASHPGSTGKALSTALKRGVVAFSDQNATPASSSDPQQPTYNYDLDYRGPAIPNTWLGRGIIDAEVAVNE